MGINSILRFRGQLDQYAREHIGQFVQAVAECCIGEAGFDHFVAAFVVVRDLHYAILASKKVDFPFDSAITPVQRQRCAVARLRIRPVHSVANWNSVLSALCETFCLARLVDEDTSSLERAYDIRHVVDDDTDVTPCELTMDPIVHRAQLSFQVIRGYANRAYFITNITNLQYA
jgi:hypothetical protein